MSAQGDALSAERKRLNAVADRIPQHLIDGALAGGATAYPSGPLTPRETDVVVKAVAAFMSELNRDKAKAAVEAWMRENDVHYPTTYTKEGQA